MRPKRLDPNGVQTGLEEAKGWALSDDGKAIKRTFTFRNFNEAFGFMARVALVAEKLEHHPDWSNTYKTVDVTLSTHDAGGLTDLDFRLAGKMNRIAGS